MARSKKRFVEYLFEFEEPLPWTHLSDFERDFAVFFNQAGVEAEISSLMEGYAGRRVITLTKKQSFDPENMISGSEPVKSVKDQFKTLKMPSGKKVKK